MIVRGNNDGDVGKPGKSKRQVKKEKEARANATGKSNQQIAEYNNRMNTGNFTKNDHGLALGDQAKGVGTTLKGTGTSEDGAKFRRGVRGKKSGRSFFSKRSED